MTMPSSSCPSVYHRVQYQGQSGTLTLTGDSLTFQSDLPRSKQQHQEEQTVVELAECSSILKVKATAANSHANWLRLEYSSSSNDGDNDSRELLLLFSDRSYLERARRDINARRRIFGALFLPSTSDVSSCDEDDKLGHKNQYFNSQFTPPRRSSSMPSPCGRRTPRSNTNKRRAPSSSAHRRSSTKEKQQHQQHPLEPSETESMTDESWSVGADPHHHWEKMTRRMQQQQQGGAMSYSQFHSGMVPDLHYIWGHHPGAQHNHHPHHGPPHTGHQPHLYPMIAYVTSPLPMSPLISRHLNSVSSSPCVVSKHRDIRVVENSQEKNVVIQTDSDTRVVLDFSQFETTQTIAVSSSRTDAKPIMLMTTPSAKKKLPLETPVKDTNAGNSITVTPIASITKKKVTRAPQRSPNKFKSAQSEQPSATTEQRPSFKKTSNNETIANGIHMHVDEFDVESCMIAQRRQESKIAKNPLNINKKSSIHDDLPSNTNKGSKDGGFQLLGISVTYVCCAGIWWVVCFVAVFCIVLPIILIAVIVGQAGK